MKTFAVALILTLLSGINAGAVSACDYNPWMRYSVPKLQSLSSQLVHQMQGLGDAIVMDQTKFRPDLFACEVANAFSHFGSYKYHDYNMARRPLYLLRALRHLGIKKISVKDASKSSALVNFIRDLIELVKAADLPFLEKLSLQGFGVLNPVQILGLAKNMQMSEMNDWFNISINTDCEQGCKISLKELSLAIPGLNAGNVKISKQVNISFYVGTQFETVSSALNRDLTAGKMNFNFLHETIRPHLKPYFANSGSAGEFWKSQHIPYPLYSTVEGLEVDGRYTAFPIKGKFQSIYVLPNLNPDCSYLSPLLLKLEGSTMKLLRGNVVVSDLVGNECDF